MILMPDDYQLRQLIDAYSKEVDSEVAPAFELSTLESITQMVASGAGATILPLPYLEHLNHPHIATVQLIDPVPQREIGIIYRKDKFMCTATRTFLNETTRTGQEDETIGKTLSEEIIP
jgi:DNA-binding transcriptional LysR family regulator